MKKIAALLLLSLTCGCKYDVYEEPLVTNYPDNVSKIMTDNCATSGCHNSSSKAKGIDLSTYAGAKSAAGNDSFMQGKENSMPMKLLFHRHGIFFSLF